MWADYRRPVYLPQHRAIAGVMRLVAQSHMPEVSEGLFYESMR